MATTEYVPRLKVQYNEELRVRLKDELGKSTVMDVPKPAFAWGENSRRVRTSAPLASNR